MKALSRATRVQTSLCNLRSFNCQLKGQVADAAGGPILHRSGGPSLAGGLEYAFGDVKSKAPREMSMFGALGVPTINLMDHLGHLAFSDAPKLASKGELTPEAFRRARAMVPFQNAPVVQEGINVFQTEVGTIWGWPE